MTDSDKIARAVSLLAMFGVTVTMVLMIIALGKLDDLTASTERLSKSSAKTSEQIDALALRMVDIERKLTALEDVVSVGRGIPVVYSKASVDPDSIQNGLYILEKDVTLKYPTRVGSYQRNFTLYHIRLSVGSGKFVTAVNAGIAVAGMSNPQFYIDYNSDNAIDHALMQEMVDFIPFSNLVARTMNEYNSQTMYNVFLDNHSSAKQITLDSIEDDANVVAKGLWIAVNNQKDRIMKLISDDQEQAEK
jgi:hypothetical protein